MLTDGASRTVRTEADASHTGLLDEPQRGRSDPLRTSPEHPGKGSVRLICGRPAPCSDNQFCLDRQLHILVAVKERSVERQVVRMIEQVENASIVGVSRDEAAAVEEVRRLEPDVILVNADDPQGGGLHVAARLNRVGATEIIVLSANDRLAAAAFDTGALDYLVTPLRDSRLRRALDRARARCADRDARRAALALEEADGATLHIPDRNGGKDVRVRDIVWIGADRDYALIHAQERTYLIRSTMARLAGMLPPSIVRVHRSALVSLKHVRRWKTPVSGVHGLQLSNGTEVTVGPSYLAAVRDALRSLDR